MEDKRIDNTESEMFDIYSADEHYKKHVYKKKKRGILGFFARIGEGIANGWRKLKKWQKSTVSTLTAIIDIVLVLLIVFLSMFDYNYKDISIHLMGQSDCYKIETPTSLSVGDFVLMIAVILSVLPNTLRQSLFQALMEDAA